MNAIHPAVDYLPHNIEAEQALLGAVLVNNDAALSADGLVESEHFFEPLHQKLWTIMGDMLRGGKVVTPLTLSVFLGPDATMDVGGMTAKVYLARLCAEATTVINAPDFARTVRELWARRRLINFSRELQAKALGGFDDIGVEALLEEADSELHAIRFGKGEGGVIKLSEALTQSIDLTAKAYQGIAEIGMESSVQDLAALLGPLMRGDLITMLAASGNGKTALAAQLLIDAAQVGSDGKRAPMSCLMFSQEMLAVQIARRAIASESGISTVRQRKAAINVAEFELLSNAAVKLGPLPIYIDQSANQTVSQIFRKAKALKKRHNIQFVVVDHLLEIRAENPRWSKFDTIENSARQLKKMAKELDVTVVLLAQVTREAQKRDHWRIRDQDLFGGDVVKQCSDVMFSVSIPLVWYQQRQPAEENREDFLKWMTEADKWAGKAEIGVLKMRDGENGGRITIGFDGTRMRFSDQTARESLPDRNLV